MKEYLAIIPVALLVACGGNDTDSTAEALPSDEELRAECQEFLNKYSSTYQGLYYASAEAEWKANTYIVEGDSVTKAAVEAANQAFANFTGSKGNIEACQKHLEVKDQLTDIQVKQLEAILYAAGANPETAGDIVAQKIKADAAQTEKLFGYDFQIDGKSVSPNEIDGILHESTDLEERLKAWESSKEVGVGLKDGLANLRNLRNQSVQALGYDDYFAYQVSEYGMTTAELQEVCQGMMRDIWPLYRELHTWARYELAEKYGEEVPEMLPAHWLPNRWGQDWVPLVHVEGVDLDPKLKANGAEWIVKQGEGFYTSLGFPGLPESFYEKSSLYPLPEDADYKKNNHASAWHLNLDNDVRSLMSIDPNTHWWETTLHELGHIYYYISYTNDDVPIVLRGGANRAYHEAMGSLLGLASMQKPFLVERGLLEEGVETDETQTLLKEALNYIVLIPWGAGVMTEFERELYAENIPQDQFNQRWWNIKRKYQGISPPNERGEKYCDAASKTHINNDAAQYYDYAMSFVLLFQFHDHISKNILNQDPHATNYWGNKDVGKFLGDVMYPGASVDWREHLKASIGSEMSAQPMVDYFAPLMDYLKQENEGREHTLPENF